MKEPERPSRRKRTRTPPITNPATHPFLPRPSIRVRSTLYRPEPTSTVYLASGVPWCLPKSFRPCPKLPNTRPMKRRLIMGVNLESSYNSITISSIETQMKGKLPSRKAMFRGHVQFLPIRSLYRPRVQTRCMALLHEQDASLSRRNCDRSRRSRTRKLEVSDFAFHKTSRF